MSTMNDGSVSEVRCHVPLLQSYSCRLKDSVLLLGPCCTVVDKRPFVFFCLDVSLSIESSRRPLEGVQKSSPEWSCAYTPLIDSRPFRCSLVQPSLSRDKCVLTLVTDSGGRSGLLDWVPVVSLTNLLRTESWPFTNASSSFYLHLITYQEYDTTYTSPYYRTPIWNILFLHMIFGISAVIYYFQ